MATTHYGFTTVNGSDTVDVQKAVNTPLQQIDDTVYVETNEPLVVIGDSWGQGWSPDGTHKSWIDYMKDNFSVLDSIATGGSGFVNGTTFTQQMTTVANRLTQTQRDSVKFVVVGGGINDYAKSLQDIDTGVSNFISNTKSSFKNAKIIILYMCIAANTEFRGYYATRRSYIIGNEICNIVNNNINVYFLNMTPFLYRASFFASDGFHPTEAGQRILGNNVCAALRGLNVSNIINSIETKFGLADNNAFTVHLEHIALSTSGVTSEAYISGNLNISEAQKTFSNTLFSSRSLLLTTEYFPLIGMRPISFTQQAILHFTTYLYDSEPVLFHQQPNDDENIKNFSIVCYCKVINANRNNFLTDTLTQVQCI